MKKAPLFLFLLLFSLAVHAQTGLVSEKPSKKMAVEVSAGYSMVLGDYGKFDRENSKSGYAANGWLVQLTFDWLGNSGVGLAFQYTYQRNALLDTARGVNPIGVDTNFMLGTRAWSNHYLMLGPVFMKTFKRVSIDVRALAGYMLAFSPNFTYTDPVTKQNVTGGAGGFAFQFSAGIGYAVSEHFIVKFNINYLGAFPQKKKEYKAQFLGYYEEIDPETGEKIWVPVWSDQIDINIKKTISTLNPGLGLIYRF